MLLALLALLACARPPQAVAPPPAADLLYFAMVDRFANGDPKNDGDADLSDPAAFHGGDLAGIVKHLDYLRDLGVKTLWISPVFDMREEKIDGHGAFHGYWTLNPGRVSARFGDEADLRRLRDELHRRDMRLVLDMVWNHVGYDAPLTEQRPEWFHHEGDIRNWDDPIERVTHDVHGLPDLAVEEEAVYGWLLHHAETWLHEVRPDGVRIDAVRHMPLTFQARIAEDLRAAGGQDLWLVGEAFEGDPAKLAGILAGGGFSAVFDFPMHYAMVDVFCRDRGVGRLASTLSQDRAYGEALRQNPGALVTFLDNHDVSRVLSACGGDPARVQQALFFQMMSRGTPSLTWGTEIGLSGAGEPENRGDMRFDVASPLTETVRRLAAARANHPSLTASATLGLSLSETGYVSARVSPDEVALLGVNRGDTPLSVEVPQAWRAGGNTGGLSVGADGALQDMVDIDAGLTRMMVPPHGSAVLFFRASAPGGFQAWVDQAWADTARREVVLDASLPDLAEGEAALWVGAGDALGAWDPSRAVPIVDGRASVEAPVGAVLASKIVLRRADGSITWEQGEDRAILVTAGEAPLRVEAVWRAP